MKKAGSLGRPFNYENLLPLIFILLSGEFIIVLAFQAILLVILCCPLNHKPQLTFV